MPIYIVYLRHNKTSKKGNKMIKITIKTYEGPTYTKTVDRMGTPDSGINCLVDDVVFGTFMRCEVKEVNWRFV